MAESENNKGKSEERVFEDEKAQNNSEHGKENNGKVKLGSKLQEITLVYLKYLTEFWEEIQWNNYLYGAKEMDCFQLPVVNAYLSEWKDEDNFDEALIFEKCRTCLKIIDMLNFAIEVCVHATEHQRDLWREGISNLQETVVEKLNYLSYILLKNGEKYINPKSGNIEYGTKDNDDDCLITLCLWANIYAAVRKQGMSKLGFSFKLPMDIVQENCVVRILHTHFNQVSLQKQIPEGKIEKDRKAVDAYVPEDENVSEDASEVIQATEATFEITEHEKEMETVENQCDLNDEAKNENLNEAERITSITEKENEMLQAMQRKLSASEDKTQVITKEQLSNIQFPGFDPDRMPPLVEPGVRIVDADEYFIVGGDFHFDLCTAPRLNVRVGDITYIHREKAKLRRIHYKRKIVPPRKLSDDTPYIVTVYENNRFQHELDDAIFVQLKLPKKVMYLSIPEPARYFPEKSGYSKNCIFCEDYKKDSSQISFKTNQFGTFVMLQKKYLNLPYKKWMLKASDDVMFSLSGSKLEIDIRVSIHGYTVTFLHPDDNLILSEIDSTWMTFDLLNQKLLAVGINIVLGENADKFADICKKEKSFEDDVYDCMALLCPNVTFMSVSKCTSAEDEIVLEYSTGKKEEIRRVMIRNNEVIDYEKEVKRIEKAKAALKRMKDLEAEDPIDESSEPKKISEEQVIERDAIEVAAKAEEVKTENSSKKKKEQKEEATEEESNFCNLYDYVLHGMDETRKQALMNTNACLIENVLTLLKLCRPISSM